MSISLEGISNFLAGHIEESIVAPMLKISGSLVLVGGLIQGESTCYSQVKKMTSQDGWERAAAISLLVLGILSGVASAVVGGALIASIAAYWVIQIPTVGTPLVTTITALIAGIGIAGAKGYHTYTSAECAWAQRYAENI